MNSLVRACVRIPEKTRWSELKNACCRDFSVEKSLKISSARAFGAREYLSSSIDGRRTQNQLGDSVCLVCLEKMQ